MPMIKQILSVFIFLNFCYAVSAQNSEAKDYIISGNQSYHQGDFAKAEAKYKIALSEDSNSIKANYNLGNALYRQKRLEESRVHYDRIVHNSKASNHDKHKAYHNIGKTYLDENNPEKAVANLKEALKLNPYDDETRYNYALARKLLEKQQEEKDQKNQQENQENSEENKDKSQKDSENQEESGDNPDNKEQNPQNQSGNQQGGENGKEKGEGDTPQGQQITKGSDGGGTDSPKPMNTERQEGLLEALRQQEQETLKKIISQKTQKVRVNTEKDW
ncbi:MAG TPA: tetratricopeptide repeat protein [Moheibacter sp.]|nr:tetratricopeptide repeat protein [Moheibacter sp.]